MSGFVTAAALVRPSKSVLDLEASSVVKRMKDKAFARAVNRDDLRRGAEELGLPLDEHIANVIRFMRERADALGLRGTSSDGCRLTTSCLRAMSRRSPQRAAAVPA